jgi:hypothetical protein
MKCPGSGEIISGALFWRLLIPDISTRLTYSYLQGNMPNQVSFALIFTPKKKSKQTTTTRAFPFVLQIYLSICIVRHAWLYLGIV